MAKRVVPFFPLKLVAFPGEQVNLHIFEPRYKQLINECLDTGQTFVIPLFSEMIKDFGSEMKVERLVKRYETGEMDIITRCQNAVQIFSFHNKLEPKLYAGGEVEAIENIQDQEPAQWEELRALAKRLIKVLKMESTFDVDLVENSFELAHKLGLSLEQEYDMLKMVRESQRQAYMINHLKRALPLVSEMERAKEKIKMNGHFQHHDPLNF